MAKAADATRNAGSAQVKFHATVDVAGRHIPMTGEGITSTRDDATAHMTMAFTIAGKQQTMDEVMRDGKIYLGGGPFAGKLPFGKKWMAIDLKKLTAEHGGDMSRFDQGGGNATRILDYLRGAGDVRKVGPERVRGVPATHYHATIDLKKAAEKAGDEQMQKFLEDASGGAGSAPADVWIDKQGRLRRISQTMPMKTGTMHMTIDYVRFGVVLNVDAPPDDQVFDATGVVEKQISQAGG